MSDENQELAAPQFVEDTDFGLTNITANQRFLQKLESKKSRVEAGTVKLVSGLELPINATGTNQREGYYWISYEGLIIWIAKFKKFQFSWMLVRIQISQVLLWRDPTPRLPDAFTTHMFFNFVLKRHKCVLSDKEQTPAGQRFWIRRMQEALRKNLRVALVDFNTQSYEEVTDREHLAELVKRGWGDERSYQNKRWLIW